MAETVKVLNDIKFLDAISLCPPDIDRRFFEWLGWVDDGGDYVTLVKAPSNRVICRVHRQAFYSHEVNLWEMVLPYIREYARRQGAIIELLKPGEALRDWDGAGS